MYSVTDVIQVFRAFAKLLILNVQKEWGKFQYKSCLFTLRYLISNENHITFGKSNTIHQMLRRSWKDMRCVCTEDWRLNTIHENFFWIINFIEFKLNIYLFLKCYSTNRGMRFRTGMVFHVSNYVVLVSACLSTNINKK